MGFPGGSLVKNLPAPVQENQETWVSSLGQEDPLKEEMQPTPVFLLKKFHGQSNLESYSPWGHKELDTNQWLSEHSTQKWLPLRLE